MELQERETAAYETEYRNTAARLMREMPPFKEAEQLLELVQTHFSLTVRRSQRPKVIVLGSGFPEELIYAFGITPYWVLGGSLQTGAWAGELAPRDADPVSRSILGLMLGLEELSQDALILLPIVSDSTGKLAYLLRREGLKVHTIDIPPVKNESAAIQYERQLKLCVEVLSAHTGQHLNRRALQNAAVSVAQARQEMARLIRLDWEKPYLLLASWRMLALNSYYAADDIRHWTRISKYAPNDELEERLKQEKFAAKANRPRILVTGSPIMYPNLKIPLLIEEMGGMLAADETCMGERALYDPLTATDRSFDGMMRALAGRYTRPCTCPTFTDNRQRIFRIKQMIKDHQIQGVIYHVLRGCLVYDYEYPVLEEELEKEGIPIIRVESDYNEEDVEQLRITLNKTEESFFKFL